MLKFGETQVADEWREPPRPQASPFARRSRLHRTFDTDGEPGEVVIDMGLDLSRPIRIASGETVGFLTTEEKDALVELYEAGEPFAFIWDRLGDPGFTSPDDATFTARFTPGVTPVFTLANEQVDWWFMDISLDIWEAEGEGS